MNRFVAGLMTTVFLLCSVNVFSQDAAGTISSEGQKQAPAQTGTNSQGLPESPGTTKATENSNPPNSSPPHTDVAQSPAGAAAAPAPEVSGNVVSRPAGSAIAPPKQHQVRSILIKMGLLAGVGVAIGTVAALSLASPARVPGSH